MLCSLTLMSARWQLSASYILFVTSRTPTDEDQSVHAGGLVGLDLPVERVWPPGVGEEDHADLQLLGVG